MFLYIYVIYTTVKDTHKRSSSDTCETSDQKDNIYTYTVYIYVYCIVNQKSENKPRRKLQFLLSLFSPKISPLKKRN